MKNLILLTSTCCKRAFSVAYLSLISIGLFSQTTTTITYSSLSTTECNLFASSNKTIVNNIAHITTFGAPVYDAIDMAVSLNCSSDGITTPSLGTEYTAKFPFKNGYTYSISMNAAGIASDGTSFPSITLAVNSTTYPAPTACNGPQQFTPPTGTNSFSRILNGTFTSYNMLHFTASSNYPQLVVAANMPVVNATSTASIKSITIIETAPPPPPPPCNVAAPASITGITVTNISSSSVALSWTAVTNATNYQGYYFEPATGISTASTSVTLSGLSPATTYTYDLVATNCKGSSGVTSSTFTTLPSCAAPLSPGFTGGSSATLNWGAISGASSYDVQYTIYFSSGGNTSGNVNTTTNSYVFSHSLAPSGSEIVAYVRTECSNGGISSYSSVANITQSSVKPTTLPGIGNTLIDPADNTFHLYPLPASANLNASYNASQGGKAEIVIFNQVGEVEYKNSFSVIKGLNNYQIDVNRFTNGIYFARITHGSNTQIQKIIIQK